MIVHAPDRDTYKPIALEATPAKRRCVETSVAYRSEFT